MVPAGSPRTRGQRDCIEEAFASIRSDRTRGAGALAAEALTALSRLADGWAGRSDRDLRIAFRQVARSLEQVQPAMGPFLRWAKDWRTLAPASARGDGVARARSWIRRERSRLRAERPGLIRTSRRRFPSACHVVTLSRSQSVRWALLALGAPQRPARVSVLESLPGGEGRHFANELRKGGLPARVVPDAQGVRTVEGADLLVVGADAVFSDGSVVHKVGTAALARAAARSGVPVIVIAGLSKFAGRPPPHRALPVLFDRTPSRYITEIWTDRGVRLGGARRRLPSRRPSL